MKILHTIQSLDVTAGGTAKALFSLVSHQAKFTDEVYVWAPYGSESVNLPNNITILKGRLPQYRGVISSCDVIHDHGIWLSNNRSVARLSRELSVPRIVSPHGMLEPWCLNHRKWKKKIAWHIYQKADLQSAAALHATAPSEAEQFKALGLNPKTFIVANGVEIPSLEDLEALPSSNNDKTEKTVLFLSRIHPKKGLPMWLEVWKRVRPIGWKMRVVGSNEGGHLEQLKLAVKKANLEKAWSFEPFVKGGGKWKAFKDADLFVLPTYSENFGIVVAESLAAETPVITTKGAPWEELVKNDCGWWCEANEDGLQKAFEDALARCDKLSSMGIKGRKWVEKTFASDFIAKQMLDVYEACK